MMTMLRFAYRYVKKCLHAVQHWPAIRFSSIRFPKKTAAESPVFVKHAPPENRLEVAALHRQPAAGLANGHRPDEGNVTADAWPPDIGSWKPTDTARFFEDGHVSREALEDWISAGLLYPEEIREAEKLIKVMRRRST